MPEPDLIELFVRPLERLQIRYVLTGSVAAMLYGEPRVTHDIHLVVFLTTADILRLTEAYPLAEFYVPPIEVLMTEATRTPKGQFNVIHIGSALKGDFHTANRDAFHAWAFRNARRYSIAGLSIRLAPPEYVIVRKLEYFREGGSEKHLRDIRGMLRISGELLDRAALEAWVRRQGVTQEWDRVRA